MDDEKPPHRVYLDAFYMDKYEVTNRLFDKFVREKGHRTAAEREGSAYTYTEAGKWESVTGANWRQPEGGTTVLATGRAEHPVVSISWEDADAYCRWAGKRCQFLPFTCFRLPFCFNSCLYFISTFFGIAQHLAPFFSFRKLILYLFWNFFSICNSFLHFLDLGFKQVSSEPSHNLLSVENSGCE